MPAIDINFLIFAAIYVVAVLLWLGIDAPSRSCGSQVSRRGSRCAVREAAAVLGLPHVFA